VRCWCTSAWIQHGEPVTGEHVVLARQEHRGRWLGQVDHDLGITEVRVRSFDLVALDTFRLGTPYTVVARAAARTLRHPALRGRAKARGDPGRPDPVLVIEATAGIGRVSDLLREQGLDWRHLTALSLTWSGDTETRGADGRVHLPKRLLVGALRNQLLAGRFRVAADLPEAAAFMDELQNFEATITPTGHDRYEGRAGTHDDRVMAAAMACWWGSNVRSPRAAST
jgi:hypothetical protein